MSKFYRPSLEIRIEYIENEDKEIFDSVMAAFGVFAGSNHSVIRVIPMKDVGPFEIRQYFSSECKKHGKFGELSEAIQSAEALADRIVGDGNILTRRYGSDGAGLRDGRAA